VHRVIYRLNGSTKSREWLIGRTNNAAAFGAHAFSPSGLLFLFTSNCCPNFGDDLRTPDRALYIQSVEDPGLGQPVRVWPLYFLLFFCMTRFAPHYAGASFLSPFIRCAFLCHGDGRILAVGGRAVTVANALSRSTSRTRILCDWQVSSCAGARSGTAVNFMFPRPGAWTRPFSPELAA